MSKDKNKLARQGEIHIDEAQLFERIVEIIERRKSRAADYANQEATMMFWAVGRFVKNRRSPILLRSRCRPTWLRNEKAGPANITQDV